MGSSNMRAAIQKNQDVVLVQLEGQLNFETILPFRKQCIEKLWGEKVVFVFDGLSFVGSSGITSFFETIKDFVEKNQFQPKFCGVKPEFLKLFEAWFSSKIEIYDKEEIAVRSFSYPEESLHSKKLNYQCLGLPNQFDLKDQVWVESESAEEKSESAEAKSDSD